MKVQIKRSAEYVRAQSIARGTNVEEYVTGEIDPTTLSEATRTRILDWWKCYPPTLYSVSIWEPSGHIEASPNVVGGLALEADIFPDQLTSDHVDAHLEGIARRAADLRTAWEAPVRAIWADYERDGAGVFLELRKHHLSITGLDNADGWAIKSDISDPLNGINTDVWNAAIDERNRRNDEIYTKGHAQASALAAQAAEGDAKAEADAEAERRQWIEVHGSDRLKRLVEEEIEHEAVYLDERLALDRPGWRWERKTPGVEVEARNARQDGLDLLDEARKTDEDAKLVWWRIEHEHDDGDPYDECPEYEWRGYACRGEFLGKAIVYGVPDEYTL